MPHNWILCRHIKGQEAWKCFPFIEPLLLEEAHQHNPYPSVQGTDHKAKELGRAAKKPGNQQQDKDSQGELQVRNSRCHFEKELQKSWFVARHTQVKRHESGLRGAPNPGGPRDLITIGSLRQAVLTHGSTTCTCLSKSLKRHMLKLSSKLVALTPVLGTTFGNSAEDMTFYGQHHTWWTAQPSTPVN